jgi:hypothetical protein
MILIGSARADQYHMLVLRRVSGCVARCALVGLKIRCRPNASHSNLFLRHREIERTA